MNEKARLNSKEIERRRRAKMPEKSPLKLQRENEQLKAENIDLSANNAELESQATHDPLTGLLNRRGLAQGFNQNIRLLKHSFGYDRVAYFLIDVDDFKIFNTQFGQPGGDKVLASMGKVLSELFKRHGEDPRMISRRGIDVVARLGGDEFVFCCLVKGDEEVDIIADMIISAVQENATKLAGLEGSPDVTVSIGVGAVDNSSLGEEDVYKRVASALLEAKAGGKNSFVNIGLVESDEIKS